LVEAMVVVAIVAILTGLILPTVGRARDLASLGSCKSHLRSVHSGLMLYATEHRRCLPPFAFSDPFKPDLLLSGHWGGTQNPNDPTDPISPQGKRKFTNLYCLVVEEFVDAQALVCPGADQDLRDDGASFFPYTDQFSSYCLRFPDSDGLFSGSPPPSQHRLNVYRFVTGGQWSKVGTERLRVPQVRLDSLYDLTDGEEYSPPNDALLVDPVRLPAEKDGDYRVIRERSHGPWANVLFGDGAVRSVTMEGEDWEELLEQCRREPSNDIGASCLLARRLWKMLETAER
jgi:prepilin-type processing-associated H-X9-DG protein